MGFLLIALAIFSALTSFICAKFITREIDDMVIITFWWFLSSTIISMFFLFSSRVRKGIIELKKHWLFILSVGLLSVAIVYFWFLSIDLAGIGFTTLWRKTEAVFVLILSLIFLKERFKLKELSGILIAVTGAVLFVSKAKSFNQQAMIAVLFCSLFYALIFVSLKKYAFKFNLFSFVILRCFLVTIFLSLFMAFSQRRPQLPGNFWTITLLFLGSATGIILHKYFFYSSLRYLEAAKAQAFYNLETVFTLVAGILIFGEAMSLFDFIFGGLIVIGALLIMSGGKESNPAKTTNLTGG
ncbi:MAG: DMT family transporter [Candidatus Omnitrophica bacterium]|nr:DMT family transporter [Candidatus Omnitrophota bacterium]